MSKKYDVCAIGNALVDYEIEVKETFLSENNIEKGLMTLVEEEHQFRILDKVGGNIKKKQAGGSAANSIIGLAQFGGQGYYTCKVADDSDGKFFINDLIDNGIDSNLVNGKLATGITGKCLIMITPDAERTMNTFLGITTDMSRNELNRKAIKDSKYLFIEGFLVSSKSAIDAVHEARKVAKENNVKMALTFSDPAMVKYFGDQMRQITADGLDMLFCNEEEMLVFTRKNNFEDGIKALKNVSKEFAVTRGSLGSVVYDGVNLIEIPVFEVTPVDTTGAGDMYAGAFLHGINNGLSHQKSGILASAASSQVVGKFGPRLETTQIQEVLKKIS